MNRMRKYGSPPFQTAVIHGGPGAPGSLAAFAHELAKHLPLLEPFQTKTTIDGLVDELVDVLSHNAQPPVILIGHSWGAWLAFITAVRHNNLVRKLVLIGSAPFEQRYTQKIMITRTNRLSAEERIEFDSLNRFLSYSQDNTKRKDNLQRFFELMTKTDSYNVMHIDQELLNFQPEMFSAIWPQAEALRKNGVLLKMADRITCPVSIIHGDYDPHPFQGVIVPLSQHIKDLTSHIIPKCGHYPWQEIEARDTFFKILLTEVV